MGDFMKKESKQHFLLSAKARTLSVCEVMQITHEQAFLLFKEMRWGKAHPICPHCDTQDHHYFIRGRRQWRCKCCNHTFSVTSGTIFAFHKLPLKIYLVAIAIYANAVKGLSALQLGRDLGVQYKTAFVLAHKIRESLIEQRDDESLSGEVHMDGAYVNGHIRPKNRKEDRIDRRKAEHQNPNKRCIMVLRQKTTNSDMQGADKTKTYVIYSENQMDINQLANEHINLGSTIHSDESTAYDTLNARFATKRVNHQYEYCSEEGITNNLAESYFSRFRRMQLGQMHKFGVMYLANYANEAAYREDTRRWSNGEIFTDILSKCAQTATHKDWCGYWQGNKRKTERLAC